MTTIFYSSSVCMSQITGGLVCTITEREKRDMRVGGSLWMYWIVSDVNATGGIDAGPATSQRTRSRLDLLPWRWNHFHGSSVDLASSWFDETLLYPPVPGHLFSTTSPDTNHSYDRLFLCQVSTSTARDMGSPSGPFPVANTQTSMARISLNLPEVDPFMLRWYFPARVRVRRNRLV